MIERTGNAPVTGATSIILDGDAVHAVAPLGAVLRYFDGAPQPPARHTRKLRDWQTRNSTGRLVEKSPAAAKNTQFAQTVSETHACGTMRIESVCGKFDNAYDEDEARRCLLNHCAPNH